MGIFLLKNMAIGLRRDWRFARHLLSFTSRHWWSLALRASLVAICPLGWGVAGAVHAVEMTLKVK